MSSNTYSGRNEPMGPSNLSNMVSNNCNSLKQMFQEIVSLGKLRSSVVLNEEFAKLYDALITSKIKLFEISLPDPLPLDLFFTVAELRNMYRTFSLDTTNIDLSYRQGLMLLQKRLSTQRWRLKQSFTYDDIATLNEFKQLYALDMKDIQWNLFDDIYKTALRRFLEATEAQLAVCIILDF